MGTNCKSLLKVYADVILQLLLLELEVEKSINIFCFGDNIHIYEKLWFSDLCIVAEDNLKYWCVCLYPSNCFVLMSVSCMSEHSLCLSLCHIMHSNILLHKSCHHAWWFDADQDVGPRGTVLLQMSKTQPKLCRCCGCCLFYCYYCEHSMGLSRKYNSNNWFKNGAYIRNDSYQWKTPNNK